jgi:hypothetical protein
MLYRDVYWSLNAWFPIHLFFHNLIWDLLFNWNDPKRRKFLLTFINSDQKWESPGFLSTFPIVWFERYFFRRIVCHKSSSFISLKSHLLNKHSFCIFKFYIPKLPWSLGWHIMLHLVSLYFFFWMSCCQKPGIEVIYFFKESFGTSKKESINMGTLVSTELISTNLPPIDMYFSFQLLSFFSILSSIFSQSNDVDLTLSVHTIYLHNCYQHIILWINKIHSFRCLFVVVVDFLSYVWSFILLKKLKIIICFITK